MRYNDLVRFGYYGPLSTWRHLLRHDHPTDMPIAQAHPELLITDAGRLEMRCPWGAEHDEHVQWPMAYAVLERDKDEVCLRCGERMAPVLRRTDMVYHRWYRMPADHEPLEFELLRALARPSDPEGRYTHEPIAYIFWGEAPFTYRDLRGDPTWNDIQRSTRNPWTGKP